MAPKLPHLKKTISLQVWKISAIPKLDKTQRKPYKGNHKLLKQALKWKSLKQLKEKRHKEQREQREGKKKRVHRSLSELYKPKKIWEDYFKCSRGKKKPQTLPIWNSISKQKYPSKIKKKINTFSNLKKKSNMQVNSL